jgi:hypothetical protein
MNKQYFDANTGELYDEDQYPDKLTYAITSRWYPVYNRNDEYGGSESAKKRKS